jgi:hypothetical protein
MTLVLHHVKLPGNRSKGGPHGGPEAGGTMPSEAIQAMDKEQLLQLIDIYARNWLAMDGVWFQSVESKRGMAEAIEHDENAWRVFTSIEAARIKTFLDLPEHPGLEGLRRALPLRLYASINADEIIRQGDTLVYRTLDCRVQNARQRKGMPFHPCRSVGLIEYTGFARAIDDRLTCEVLSCYPEINDTSCSCAWKFSLNR